MRSASVLDILRRMGMHNVTLWEAMKPSENNPSISNSGVSSTAMTEAVRLQLAHKIDAYALLNLVTALRESGEHPLAIETAAHIQVPRLNLAALHQLGLFTTADEQFLEWVLSWAKTIVSERERSEFLALLPFHLSSELRTKTLSMTRDMQYAFGRVNVIIALAQKTPDPTKRRSLFLEAYEIAEAIEDTPEYIQAHLALASLVDWEDWSRPIGSLINSVASIESESARANLLYSLVQLLEGALQTDYPPIEEICDYSLMIVELALHHLPTQHYQDMVVYAVAALTLNTRYAHPLLVPETIFRRALDEIKGIKDPTESSQALEDLLPLLGGGRNTDIMETLDHAKYDTPVRQPYDRTVIHLFIEYIPASLLSEMVELAFSLPSILLQSITFAALIPRLDDTFMNRLLDYIKQLPSQMQIDILIKIVHVIPSPYIADIIQHVESLPMDSGPKEALVAMLQRRNHERD